MGVSAARSKAWPRGTTEVGAFSGENPAEAIRALIVGVFGDAEIAPQKA